MSGTIFSEICRGEKMGFFFPDCLPIARIRSRFDTAFAYDLSSTEFSCTRTMPCSADKAICLPSDGAPVNELLLSLLVGESTIGGGCGCGPSFVLPV
jgi:hypothetical protein